MAVMLRMAPAIAGVCLGAASFAAKPPVVDFESLPSELPVEGASISDEYWDSCGVRFSDLEPGHTFVLGRVGAPFTAFRGYLGLADFPYPGAGPLIGNFFLTDDHGGTGTSPGPFVIDYRWPVRRVSGIFMDVDEHESWRAEAFDAAGASRGSVEIFPTLLPGVAISWSLKTDAAVITRVVITFTGSPGPNGVTFALDNLSGSEPVCAADLSGDGQIDFADYLVFLNLFAAGDPQADFNGDGQVDFSDYLEFVNDFDDGC